MLTIAIHCTAAWLVIGSFVWAMTFHSAARLYAIRSAALHHSRAPVLRYLTAFTILAWPLVVWGYARAYVRQVQWRGRV